MGRTHGEGMKPIPPEVEATIEPGFKDAVAGEAQEILMSLDAFAGEPENFYNHMWYANSKGKTVVLVARPKGTPSTN